MTTSIFGKSELCKTCAHTKLCYHDKNICGDVFVAGNPMVFDNNKLWEKYKEREAKGFPCDDYLPEIVRCKDCRHLEILNGENYYARCKQHGRLFDSFGNVDTRTWFCADGERREDDDEVH